MLILTAKEGEKFLIGDEITVKVVEIRGKQIRLGFERRLTYWFSGKNWLKNQRHDGSYPLDA